MRRGKERRVPRLVGLYEHRKWEAAVRQDVDITVAAPVRFQNQLVAGSDTVKVEGPGEQRESVGVQEDDHSLLTRSRGLQDHRQRPEEAGRVLPELRRLGGRREPLDVLLIERQDRVAPPA